MGSKWQTFKLRDICEKVNYGYTASAKPAPVGPKFLRITDIVPETIAWESVPYCEIPVSDLAKYELSEGDIVIARTGATTGFAKRIRKGHPKSVFASYLVRLRICPEIADSDFIGHIVESQVYKQFITANLGGAAQPQANAQILTSYEITLPPLPIQRKIAAILSAYDDLIENNIRRIALLESMAQALYREWFVRFRFPGHEDIPLADSPLGPIPQGWRVVKQGDVCEIVMGQSPSSEFYNESGDGLPFHQGVRDFGEHFPTDRVYCTATSVRIAEPGDVLFSVRAPVGRINTATHRIILGRGLSAIRSSTANQAFVYFQLKDKFQEEDSMGNGSIFKAVSKDDMRGIEMLWPPASITETFERQATPIFEQIKTLTFRNTNLRRTRDLLLPKLVSGEVDVAGMEIAAEN